jgi:hypothetical protein
MRICGCSDAFAQLLAGDDLDVSASTQLKSELPWADLLRKICFFGHFSGTRFYETPPPYFELSPSIITATVEARVQRSL